MTRSDQREHGLLNEIRCMEAYREVISVPVALLDHISVAIEEGLYAQAFDLLYSSLIAGTGTPRPGYVPPARYVALAGTLTVHPSMTSRTNSEDKHETANDALRYLLALNRTVGAKRAHFDAVFHFGRLQDDRSNRLKHRKSANLTQDPIDELRCVYVDQRSVWTHADDFWHLLGWALNCSILLPCRWGRWKLLLSFMLDAFEDDLAHTILQQQAKRVDGENLNLSGTLISQHLSTIGTGRDNRRRIMRAVLADGTSKSLAEFGEVFKDEAAPPKQASKSKRHSLDLDQGKYGDYDDDDDASDQENGTAAKSLRSKNDTDNGIKPVSTANDYSDGEATEIRLRVLAMLAQVCIADQTAFLHTEDLFDLYTEFLRLLPVRAFQTIIVGLGRLLDDDTFSSLLQMLLRPMIDSAAPVYNKNDLDQEEFEKHFAPFAANSSGLVENAKVSLLIESLLRLLWQHKMLSPTDSLQECVSAGVKARQGKVASAYQGNVEHQYEEQFLRSSGERILACLSMMKQ